MSGKPGHWRESLVQFAESVVLILGAAWVMVRPALVSLPSRWVALKPDFRRRIILAAIAVLGLFHAWGWRDVPGHWLAWLNGQRPLYAVKSWHYQLDKGNLGELAKSSADAMVIDFAVEGGKVPLTPEEVARLKTAPDGRHRFVIAYMSVGEAERYRFYFREEWKTAPPPWLGPENCAWPGAHKVKFWHDEWKDIVWRGEASYLKSIVDAGFDGVYLDRVDIYDMYPEHEPARDDMIQFVTDLSATAKRLKPGFLVIPQNADDLIDDRAYRSVIDGLGREDLLYGANETGKRNPAEEIRQHQKNLNLLLWEWKPVLAVEYLQSATAIEAARAEMKGRGLVPTFQPRALDGRDPTDQTDLKNDVGTAEYTRAKCEKGKAW